MNIRDYLGALSNNTVYYFPNRGNAGDTLIAHVTYQLFRKNNVDFRVIRDVDSFDSKGKIIFFGGGGSLVEHYDFAGSFVSKFHRLAQKMVILPQTISGNEYLLGELGRNVDIICREKTSYIHVKTYASEANVFLMDDLAFSLNVEKTMDMMPKIFLKSILFKLISKLSGGDSLFRPPSIRMLIANKFFVKRHKWGQRNKKIYCFREDSESLHGKIPTNNIDLSSIFMYNMYVMFDEKFAHYIANELLGFIMQCDELWTDRLHLAIAGAILGKKVKFYANSYYKNHAVYLYSMKDKYPNVQWQGEKI